MRTAILSLLAVAAAARSAAATPYEAFIDVADQADLEDLRAAGAITQDTYEELLELLQIGVDLSTADRARLYSLPNLTYDDVERILAYRDAQRGAIRDPAVLVAAGALSAEKLRALSAFLATSEGAGARGWVQAMTRFTMSDQVLPPLALRGRLAASDDLQAGFAAVFTRRELGAPIFEPNRGVLIADRRGYGGVVPKLFLKYEDDDTTAIAGSFRAGFGQRLVFDNTRQATPNGLYADDGLFYAQELELECRESAGELEASPCAGAAGGRYVTPDFRYREGLLGAGLGWKRRALDAGWLQAYAWASSARRSMSQDELVDRARCPDPHDDTDPACAPPEVLVRPDGSILAPTSGLEHEVLPRVFAERLAGANVTYFADRRNAVGVTAYGAMLSNLVGRIELDTQEHAHLPTGRWYGALGANFSLGRGWLDVSGEVALGLDRLPDGPGPQAGGGGPAAILRVTATAPRQELEAALRYYGIDYANPYARPLSQADELDGQRARDEVGARLRYDGAGRHLAVHALLDLWAPLSSLGEDSPLGRSQPKLDSYLRADVRPSRGFELGLWLRLQDQDLLASGHAQCFAASSEDSERDERGEPLPCSGRQLTTSGRARLELSRALGVTAMLDHRLVDDGLTMDSPFQDRFRRDVAGWLIAHWRPDGRLHVRARARYLHEAINEAVNEAMNDAAGDRRERSFSALLDAALGLGARSVVRARADVKRWLDERPATLERSPNPELQLWLSYEARL